MLRVLSLTIVLAALICAPASAQTVEPPFDTAYALTDLGAPPGVPAALGGLTLKAGTTDRLLIGGAANGDAGALYEIGVKRDASGHINGFSGEATRYADAAFNDGGITYGPGDVLFLARWPADELGQTKPGSTKTDKIVDLSVDPYNVESSISSLLFVPQGLPGAGHLKMTTYEGGKWYSGGVSDDGNGTYNVEGLANVPDSTLPGAPEGFVYVASGSPQFAKTGLLISEYGAGNVAAYEVDANGDPVVSTRRTFISGLDGAEGALIDPVTGDFLFSTFGGGDRVVVVRGFVAPATVTLKTHVINDDLGASTAGDFSVHMRDNVGADVAGSPVAGSESGTTYTLPADVQHTVNVDPPPGYDVTISGDCSADGHVTPATGVAKTCTITADDQEPATLKVVTHVVNDEGGKWQASDFTSLLGGEETAKPGSETGVDYLLIPGSYTLTQEAARGYTHAADPACTGTITLAPMDTKTCTITDSDVPAPPGLLVVDGYGPIRTDGEWGLDESFLSRTRGYLTDPALFGPSGTVKQAFTIAPGIREANARTLAGVDVFFTGWVATDSYTDAEKDALVQFVKDGGTLIATTDDPFHTMVDAFGLTQAGGSGSPMENVITAPFHALANGAFGTVASYRQYDLTGHYSALGPNAHEIGRYKSGPGATLAVIERGKLGPGSGAAIFVADVDVFTDHGGATYNAALIKNIFAFAAGEKARPSVSVGNLGAAEGDGGNTAFTFTVSLSTPSPAAFRVHYATADDTATAPSDYAAAAGDLVFNPGQTAKQVTVQVHGDTAVEPNERFRLNLSNAVGGRIADPQAIGTISNDDVQSSPKPEPEPHKSAVVEPVDGKVTIKLPGSNRFIELKAGQQVPLGTVLNTKAGRVTLVAASNNSGGTAQADFYEGIFKVGQTKGKKPITVLTLVEKLDCKGSGKVATAARKKRRRRHLWGDGHGSFRTRGRNSAATVLGTKWMVLDTCTTTVTKVARGRVKVRDFVKKKTVFVKAGHKYVARAR